MGAMNGEANPTQGLVYSGSHQFVERTLSGATVADDVPVFAVVVRGAFVGYMAHVAGGHLPRGSVLTITFDANTLEVTDWSIRGNAPDVSRLGISVGLGG
jgi:hypothetical protein